MAPETQKQEPAAGPSPAPDVAPLPRKRGRPSLFTPELVRELLAAVSEGQSLRRWCAGEGRPSVRTVQSWAAENWVFCASLTRAREAWFESLLEDALHEIDNAPMTKAGIRLAAYRARLRVRLAAMIRPGRYGSRRFGT